MPGIACEEAVRLSCERLRNPSVVCGRQPRNGALRSISQFVGIELRRSASSNISAGLVGKPAQGILGTCKRLSPAFLILQLVENPPADSVLFLRRKRRHLRYRCVKASTHNMNCMRFEKSGQPD